VENLETLALALDLFCRLLLPPRLLFFLMADPLYALDLRKLTVKH
jgi:hypothetical protein